MAIPLKPNDDVWSYLNLSALAAQSDLANKRSKYGIDVFMLMVPDDEAQGGSSARLVIPADLDKTPNLLLEEGDAALKREDFTLAAIKRCAYMAITGATDTK